MLDHQRLTVSHIVDAPAEYDYEPGYYAVFVRDPDAFKLEVVHIPQIHPRAPTQ